MRAAFLLAAVAATAGSGTVAPLMSGDSAHTPYRGAGGGPGGSRPRTYLAKDPTDAADQEALERAAAKRAARAAKRRQEK